VRLCAAPPRYDLPTVLTPYNYSVGDSPQREPHRATITTTDPLGAPPDGMMIRVSTLDIEPVHAEASPVAVENWEYFDGSLLAVCVQYGDHYTIEGTAVMIGLGLAISAKHVFDDHHAALHKGEGVLLCVGLRPNGVLDVWHCYELVVSDDGGDLALLSLKLASDLPVGGNFNVLPLTARVPDGGEHLTVVGFRFDESTDSIDNPIELSGMMYVSKGATGQFSYPIHDLVIAPYPTIEVLSGTFGGMSGGAVLNRDGAVVGIISRGLQTDDQQGPSLAAWWMHVMAWRPKLSWPTGLYEQDTAVFDLPTVTIIGRENVEVTADGRVNLKRRKG
jgi:Trypsin-like peptidase domain